MGTSSLVVRFPAGGPWGVPAQSERNFNARRGANLVICGGHARRERLPLLSRPPERAAGAQGAVRPVRVRPVGPDGELSGVRPFVIGLRVLRLTSVLSAFRLRGIPSEAPGAASPGPSPAIPRPTIPLGSSQAQSRSSASAASACAGRARRSQCSAARRGETNQGQFSADPGEGRAKMAA